MPGPSARSARSALRPSSSAYSTLAHAPTLHPLDLPLMDPAPYPLPLTHPPHDPHIWPREGGFGRGGDSRLQISRKNLEYPAPDSRLQISRKNLEYPQTPDSRFPHPQTPDSRFPEKIWSTSRLQTPDFKKKSGLPGLWTPDSGVCNLESGAASTPDFFWKSGVWSLGSRYSRFFLEIWSLESGARVLQIFSGNLESGVRGPGTPDFFWKSGVWSPGPGYSRFFLEIWSPGPGHSRFFLEIWSLESGARVLQIFSGNLESGVRGPGTPDFFWKSGVWSLGSRYSRFFLEIWSLESGARVLQIFSRNLVFRV